MRKKIVAGNWKMNTSLEEGVKLAKSLNENINKEEIKPETGIMIAPPFVHLSSVKEVIDNERVCLAAQNCAFEESGAFTGEVSAKMLKSVGVKAVIIGHSERRSIYKEDDETIAKKIASVLKNDMKAVFCCGESLDMREQAKHFDIVKKQIENVFKTLSEKDMKNIIVAYEPVWAIGTGVTASAMQAQEMHAFIRGLLDGLYNKEISDNMTILYGGSVKPKNAAELFAQADVDGGLVGGASLDADGFTEIIKAR